MTILTRQLTILPTIAQRDFVLLHLNSYFVPLKGMLHIRIMTVKFNIYGNTFIFVSWKHKSDQVCKYCLKSSFTKLKEKSQLF